MQQRLPFEVREMYMDYASIVSMAKALGFAQIGVCSARPFITQKETVESQPELRERRQLHFIPQVEIPWASALLILIWPYQQAALPQNPDSIFLDSYYAASNQAYQAAKELEEKINALGCRAQANVSYPAKAAAVRAGLGVIGDNGLLITPDYGTRVVLILMATDTLTTDNKVERLPGECLHCGKCMASCPTGAIDCHGMSHPERCLRNYMMEGLVVPENLRPLMDMKMLGCDLCQRVCPLQKNKDEVQNHDYFLDDFLTSEETVFKKNVLRLGNVIGSNAARPQRVRAQAALLAGNRKREKDLEVLKMWENAQFEAVREHAKWAIKQIEHHTLGLDQRDEKR